MREPAQMSTVTYEAEVLEDGRLPLPKKVKLRAGQRVRVRLSVSRQKRKPRAWPKDSPLWKLVGYIHDDGPADVAERHDYYLYGHGSKNKKTGSG